MIVYDGYLVCLDWSADLPGKGVRNPSCYLLSMHWFSLEEERVMQQSSVSISLSFENQGINLVGDDAQVNEYLHKQSNKLAPNTIKGLSIPSRLRGKVRSDRDR